jgi:alpha 1,2-mannosyltransferase
MAVSQIDFLRQKIMNRASWSGDSNMWERTQIYLTETLRLPRLPKLWPTHWSRLLKPTGALFILSFLYLCYSRNSASFATDEVTSAQSRLSLDTTPTHARTYPVQLIRFWISFVQHLEAARPDCEEIAVDGNMDIAKMNFEPMYHRKPRVNYINMNQEDMAAMRISHRYMAEISRKMAAELPYTRGSRGIVTTAGGTYTSPLLVSLRMLRRSGSKLPVEVFVSSWAEYDANMCEHMLPPLNARCRILSDMFSLTPAADVISHYQYKVFSILFSSFEDVFFLDADSFPAFNPDSILQTDPFKSIGLVTWPDMFAQSSSRCFFEIAEVPIPPVSRYSTESGQILYSKRKHGASLLLATYYNYYGPDYYYRLQSQNAWGQGDKETFLHAAIALNMSFYDVKTPTWNVGQWVDDGNFRHVGMGQHHPADDFSISNGQVQAGQRIRPFLMHNNWPWKLDPSSIMNDDGPTKHPNGTYWRLWGTKDDIVDAFGYDAEAAMWEELLLRACEIDVSCDKLKTYYKTVILGEESIKDVSTRRAKSLNRTKKQEEDDHKK